MQLMIEIFVIIFLLIFLIFLEPIAAIVTVEFSLMSGLFYLLLKKLHNGA